MWLVPSSNGMGTQDFRLQFFLGHNPRDQWLLIKLQSIRMSQFALIALSCLKTLLKHPAVQDIQGRITQGAVLLNLSSYSWTVEKTFLAT